MVLSLSPALTPCDVARRRPMPLGSEGPVRLYPDAPVLDAENFNAVHPYARGLDVDSEDFALDVIADVGPR